ncbi:MAG: hypothetical protein P4L73_16185 [Caulobacteraceae bacterium]|nr:hypothetical protein [Caulobacteraceae bacterium]
MPRHGPQGHFAALALAVLAAALPRAARADATATFYERAVMVAADQRCRLFDPDLGSALAAAEAQARGAALRSGARSAVLDQVEQRARGRIAALPCNAPDIATAAARVRTAFAGYSRLQRMSYPGDVAAWLAVRGAPERVTVWKLSQTTRFGWNSATLGLAGRAGPSALLAVASFPDNAQPYTARLVLRDRSLAPEPFLNTLRANAAGTVPLAARTPPRTATIAVLAEARSGADAALLPPGARSGVAFRFPKAAVDALAALDPREAVAVDFVFSAAGGDQVRTAHFEVGDFAAGRAFLAPGQR